MEKLQGLEPCPYCGSTKCKLDSKSYDSTTGIYQHGSYHKYKRHTASIRCNSCHARGPTVSIDLPEEDYYSALDKLRTKAITAWNRRTKDDIAKEGNHEQK